MTTNKDDVQLCPKDECGWYHQREHHTIPQCQLPTSAGSIAPQQCMVVQAVTTLTRSTRSRTCPEVLSKGEEEDFLFFEAVVSDALAPRFSAGISLLFSAPGLLAARGACPQDGGHYVHPFACSSFSVRAPRDGSARGLGVASHRTIEPTHA